MIFSSYYLLFKKREEYIIYNFLYMDISLRDLKEDVTFI